MSNTLPFPVSHISMTLQTEVVRLGAPCEHMEDMFHLPVFMCVHLIQPSPDSCCRPPPCSTCSRMGRCSVSQEGDLGWSLCTCKYMHTLDIREDRRRFPTSTSLMVPSTSGHVTGLKRPTHLKKGFFKSRRLLDFDPVWSTWATILMS